LRHFISTDPDIHLRAAMKVVRSKAQKSPASAAYAVLPALVRLLARQAAGELLARLPTARLDQRESEK